MTALSLGPSVRQHGDLFRRRARLHGPDTRRAQPPPRRATHPRHSLRSIHPTLLFPLRIGRSDGSTAHVQLQPGVSPGTAAVSHDSPRATMPHFPPRRWSPNGRFNGCCNGRDPHGWRPTSRPPRHPPLVRPCTHVIADMRCGPGGRGGLRGDLPAPDLRGHGAVEPAGGRQPRARRCLQPAAYGQQLQSLWIVPWPTAAIPMDNAMAYSCNPHG